MNVTICGPATKYSSKSRSHEKLNYIFFHESTGTVVLAYTHSAALMLVYAGLYLSYLPVTFDLHLNYIRKANASCIVPNAVHNIHTICFLLRTTERRIK